MIQEELKQLHCLDSISLQVLHKTKAEFVDFAFVCFLTRARALSARQDCKQRFSGLFAPSIPVQAAGGRSVAACGPKAAERERQLQAPACRSSCCVPYCRALNIWLRHPAAACFPSGSVCAAVEVKPSGVRGFWGQVETPEPPACPGVAGGSPNPSQPPCSQCWSKAGGGGITGRACFTIILQQVLHSRCCTCSLLHRMLFPWAGMPLVAPGVC